MTTEYQKQKLQLNNLIELLGSMERYHKANIETDLSVLNSSSFVLGAYFSDELKNIQKALKLAKNIRDCPSSFNGDWEHK